MIVTLAYDEDLANRIRELMAAEDGVTEQRMFGGLAFLIGGNMAVAASGKGGLMVRVDPDDTDALMDKPGAGPFEMRGRAMQGWLRVDDEGVRTKRELEPWVERIGKMAKNKDTYVITNNHFRGQAILNAGDLKESLGQDANLPPQLKEAYPERFT